MNVVCVRKGILRRGGRHLPWLLQRDWAAAERIDGARSATKYVTKYVPRQHKNIYLRPDKFICAQINLPRGRIYLRANKFFRIHR